MKRNVSIDKDKATHKVAVVLILVLVGCNSGSSQSQSITNPPNTPDSTLPLYQSSGQPGPGTTSSPGGASKPACPNACLRIPSGKTQAQVIADFEAQNNCEVTPDAASQPSCATLPQADRIDIDFIRKREDASYNGTLNPIAVVPHNKITGIVVGHSGATIGEGIDLGQMSLAQLQGFGNLSASFIHSLTPYLGKNPGVNPHATGQAALTYLNAHPLVISQGDLSQLETLQHDVEQITIKKVVQNYNAVAYTNFWSLPGGAQTAIIDLAFQYGTNLAAKTPQFWKQVTTGQWQAAVDNLNDFGDDFRTRRKKEADKISNDITEEYLPKNDQECVK